MRIKLLLFVILSFAGSSNSQAPETAGLPDFPVPAWPQNGVIPPELKDKYVFIDLSKNEYVVAYPENLGSETFEKDGPGPIRMGRFELLRNVEPSVSVAITALSPQRYKYTYTVANAAAARQSIDQWSLVLPPQAGNDVIKNPAGWFAIVQKNRSFKLRNPDWIRNGTAAVFSFEKPEEVIHPGKVKTGFEIESELRPGFTVGYFRKAGSVDAKVATHGNVPKAVKDQIDLLLAVEYNSKTVLVIAPKFDKAEDDRTIASDFVEGISLLTRTGTLNPDSEFVINTLSQLQSIRSGVAASNIKWTSTPRGPAETDFMNALKLSLQLR